jgi:hypothetical protein
MNERPGAPQAKTMAAVLIVCHREKNPGQRDTETAASSTIITNKASNAKTFGTGWKFAPRLGRVNRGSPDHQPQTTSHMLSATGLRMKSGCIISLSKPELLWQTPDNAPDACHYRFPVVDHGVNGDSWLKTCQESSKNLYDINMISL